MRIYVLLGMYEDFGLHEHVMLVTESLEKIKEKAKEEIQKEEHYEDEGLSIETWEDGAEIDSKDFYYKETSFFRDGEWVTCDAESFLDSIK